MSPQHRRRSRTGRIAGYGVSFTAALALACAAPAYQHGPWPWLLGAACAITGRMAGVLAASTVRIATAPGPASTITQPAPAIQYALSPED